MVARPWVGIGPPKPCFCPLGNRGQEDRRSSTAFRAQPRPDWADVCSCLTLNCHSGAIALPCLYLVSFLCSSAEATPCRYHLCECGNPFDSIDNPNGCKYHKPEGCIVEKVRMSLHITACRAGWQKCRRLNSILTTPGLFAGRTLRQVYVLPSYPALRPTPPAHPPIPPMQTLDGDMKRNCPYCLVLPVLSMLRKIANHLVSRGMGGMLLVMGAGHGLRKIANPLVSRPGAGRDTAVLSPAVRVTPMLRTSSSSAGELADCHCWCHWPPLPPCPRAPWRGV